MAKVKLFNETAMNKVFNFKRSGKLYVGIDYDEECIYLSNNFSILKVGRKIADYHLKPDGKIMGFILRADNLLQGTSGTITFDAHWPQGTKGSVNLDMLKKNLTVKEGGKAVARYTGLKTVSGEGTYYIVQYEGKDGNYEYGAFDVEMIDIFPKEVGIKNAGFYGGKLGPLKYVDEQNGLEYLQLPIRFDHIKDGLGDFLK